jgi:hypothetical protein
MRLRHATAIGAIGLMALTGCGSEDKDQPTATKPSLEGARQTVPASAANIPTTKPSGPYIGAWYAKLSSKQAIDADGGDVRLAGKFRLELRSDGTYTTFQELDGESDGHYRMASDNRLVFKQDKGCDVFTGGKGSVGVYRWSVNGSHLKLTNIVPETGGCTGRTQSLVMPVWQRR